MKYVQPLDQTNPNAGYEDYNPSLGESEGSVVPGKAIEHPMREIVNVITAAGLIPSGNDLTQLQRAIEIIVEKKINDLIKRVP